MIHTLHSVLICNDNKSPMKVHITMQRTISSKRENYTTQHIKLFFPFKDLTTLSTSPGLQSSNTANTKKRWCLTFLILPQITFEFQLMILPQNQIPHHMYES